MAAKLVNLAATERVLKGTVLRVTVTQYARILLNSEFARLVTTFYEQLAGTRLLFPISPNPLLKDISVAVIDVRVVAENRVAVELVQALETLAGFYLTITRVERLTAPKAEKAAGNAGAVERETERAEQDQRDDWTRRLGLDKLGEALGVTVGVLKWTLAAIVVVGLVLLVMNARSAAAAIKTVKP